MTLPIAHLSIFQQWKFVLKRRALWLIPWGLSSVAVDQWVTGQLEELIRSPQGVDYRVWLVGTFSILISMIFPIMSLLMTYSAFKETKIIDFIKAKISSVFREILKSWGLSMLWSFFLIIPGLLKFLRYSFVPLIVCFDDSYEEGKVDAIEKSSKISKGMMIPMGLLFFSFTILIPVVLTLFGEYRLLDTHLLTGSSVAILQSAIEVFYLLLILKLYRRKVPL